jgi:hypothetical protein
MTDLSNESVSVGFWSFLRKRPVQGLVFATLLSVVLVAVLGGRKLPFDRPAIGTTETIPNLITQLVQIAFALFVIAVAFSVTRRRSTLEFDARTPPKPVAQKEMLWLLAYGVVVVSVGGFNGIGMHLHGAVFGPTKVIAPRDVFLWAAYNFSCFALFPYLVFRARGYDRRSLCLGSENLRNDVLLIVVVLIVESLGELLKFRGLFALNERQLLLGVPLTFVVELFGTGLPVMVFVYALLFPRYMKVTGSAAAAIVYGALTYAGLHLFEYWAVYDSLTNGVLTITFVFLQFTAPGLVKSYLTWRTGNAWVHLWAYHAIAPHVTVDTPHLVRVFRIG